MCAPVRAWSRTLAPYPAILITHTHTHMQTRCVLCTDAQYLYYNYMIFVFL